VTAELRIGTDPTTWYFESVLYDTVAAALAPPGGPLVVDVFSPLQGRLVLNPLAAGSVGLTNPVDPIGWNPNGAYLAKSLGMYVASGTGPHKSLPGYVLAPGYEIQALEEEIIAAMTGRSILTVTLEASLGGGVLALSGATLSYAVLCLPKPKS
jgi:hypothetical protein